VLEVGELACGKTQQTCLSNRYYMPGELEDSQLNSWVKPRRKFKNKIYLRPLIAICLIANYLKKFFFVVRIQTL